MSSDIAIDAKDLSKVFNVKGPRSETRADTLRDAIAGLGASTQRMLSRRAREAAKTTDEFWALKDVSFQIKRGDAVGVIGRNGAGKSTLLKILSRITEPTTGRVRIRGRVASLLEVGTGFHPELTGRENIYLNGAILGMSRAEIRRSFDEIVDFAGVERFLDTPVKRYSSGMYVRLAFAVAAHLEPEILVVDEVLAVGDAEFQKKCLGKMQSVAGDGRTVLFVSHNIAAISQLCSAGILLTMGRIAHLGSATSTINAYLGQSSGTTWRRPPELKPSQVVICSLTVEPQGLNSANPSLQVHVDIESTATLQAAVELMLRDGQFVPVCFSALGTHTANLPVAIKPGRNTMHLNVALPSLAVGKYYVSLYLRQTTLPHLDRVDDVVTFEITADHRSSVIYPLQQSWSVGSVSMPMTLESIVSVADL